jgi:glycosyltransferase involved in cell wall biosynthesis
MKRLSIVIVNYNYEQYVGAAIESALAVEWDDVEVVVVDDGSTDGSRAVIETYADRLQTLFTENATQRVAANRGYELTSGDVVVFLDSDDLLPPDLAVHLAPAWTSDVSKAQFRMQRIDGSGRPLGDPFPHYRPVPTPADIRRWATITTAYPTPPGSGNAYARWFLDQVMPVGPELGNASDSAWLAAAPFFGEVVTLPHVVVGYRRHTANDSNLLADVRRFPREVARARARWRFAQTSTGVPREAVDERPLFRSRELLQLRVAARRVAPAEQPLPGDGVVRLLLDAVRAPVHPGPEPLLRRITVSAWSIAALLAPNRVARLLLSARYGRS